MGQKKDMVQKASVLSPFNLHFAANEERKWSVGCHACASLLLYLLYSVWFVILDTLKPHKHFSPPHNTNHKYAGTPPRTPVHKSPPYNLPAAQNKTYPVPSSSPPPAPAASSANQAPASPASTSPKVRAQPFSPPLYPPRKAPHPA